MCAVVCLSVLAVLQRFEDLHFEELAKRVVTAREREEWYEMSESEKEHWEYLKYLRAMLAGISDEDLHVAQEDDKVDGTVKICDEVQADLDRQHVVYVGERRSQRDDRLYIRDKLHEVLQVRRSRVAIKEIVLYCPCELLDGEVQWIDAAGCNDTNPLKRRLCEWPIGVPPCAAWLLCVM